MDAPRWIGVVVLAFCSLAAAQDGDKLAQRCEEIPWQLPQGSSDTVPPQLRTIQRELIAAGRKSVPEIIAACGKSLHMRRVAPGVVSRWPADPTRKLLCRLLADPDEMVAAAAADGLARVGGREVLDPLMAAVSNTHPQVRHNALNALNNLGAANRAWKVTVVALTDPQVSVRHSAVELIAKVDGARRLKDAIERLRERADKEGDAGVKAAIQRSLRVLRAKSG